MLGHSHVEGTTSHHLSVSSAVEPIATTSASIETIGTVIASMDAKVTQVHQHAPVHEDSHRN